MKKLYLLIIIFSFYQFSWSQINDIDKYILEKYEIKIKYSESKSGGGSLIYNNPNEGYEGEPCGDSYAVDRRYYKKICFLVLEKIDCKNSKNRQVTDILLPYIEYRGDGGLQTLYCEKNEKNDSKIIAIENDPIEEDKEYYSNIVFAWILDIKTEKLIQYPTEGIKCLNEGHGL